jgi:hypothetical protein
LELHVVHKRGKLLFLLASEIVQQLNRAFPDNPQYRRDLAWIEAQANAPIEEDPSPGTAHTTR